MAENQKTDEKFHQASLVTRTLRLCKDLTFHAAARRETT
jgi:hypothetical protein